MIPQNIFTYLKDEMGQQDAKGAQSQMAQYPFHRIPESRKISSSPSTGMIQNWNCRKFDFSYAKCPNQNKAFFKRKKIKLKLTFALLVFLLSSWACCLEINF